MSRVKRLTHAQVKESIKIRPSEEVGKLVIEYRIANQLIASIHPYPDRIEVYTRLPVKQ